MSKFTTLKSRFDGFMPIVIDVETGGVTSSTDALLEIAAVLINMDDNHQLQPQQTFACHVLPFEGANLDPKALEINGIDPYHPFRFAIPEDEALSQLFNFAKTALQQNQCRRAVLVGHNAHFDLGFIRAAAKRCKIKQAPFHSFTVFDTATLGGMAYGKTVLAKALKAAGIPFDKDQAHSAIYDAQCTAELFCRILNKFHAKELN